MTLEKACSDTEIYLAESGDQTWDLYHQRQVPNHWATTHSVACITAEPGVPNLILVWSHTFVEFDHEIIYTANLLPSANHSMIKKGCFQ